VVRLIDKDSGELLGEFVGHTGKNLCLESSIDYEDSKILSGSADGKLWIWDLVSQKVVAKLSGFKPTKHPTVSISVHPQKNCFLASNGSDVLMWTTSTDSTDE
jgi:mitogen-activated protein kinase organizer 1